MKYTTADYLQNSDSNVLAEPANIFLDCFEHNITMVVKNDEGNPVLIFPENAISQIILPDPTKIDLYISINRDPPALYKFGFSTPSQASTLNQLLNELRQPIAATHSQSFRRPNRDPAVNKVFTQIKQEIPR